MTKYNQPLYLDHHATTPVDLRVLEAMLPYFAENFGNAESSQHPFGWKAKSAVDRARAQVAKLLGAEPGEIIFTSGATESIHLAILGYLAGLTQGRNDGSSNARAHIITSNAEHKCVLEVAARARELGHEVTILPVDRYGRVSADQVEAALTPETALVSLMHGNNEIGVRLAERSRQRGPGRELVFHVDAAQTAGKHPIDVKASHIGLLSLSAHKLYGPKGVGALYARRASSAVHLVPYLVGGGQERGLRGGTHNVPGIVGLGVACELALELMPSESERLQRLRDHMIERLLSAIEGSVLNGHPTERLCNNVSLTFSGVESGDLLLGLRDIAYSSSSACSSGTSSHVLQAIGRDLSQPLQATVRFGLGRSTRQEDIEWAVSRVIEAVQKARRTAMPYLTGIT